MDTTDQAEDVAPVMLCEGCCNIVTLDQRRWMIVTINTADPDAEPTIAWRHEHCRAA